MPDIKEFLPKPEDEDGITFVLVPKTVEAEINSKLDEQFKLFPDAAEERAILKNMLLLFYNEHGFVPNFCLQHKASNRSCCVECKCFYPGELLQPLTICMGDGSTKTTAPICGLCALDLMNEVYGESRTHFDGKIAESLRQAAETHLKESDQVRKRGKDNNAPEPGVPSAT